MKVGYDKRIWDAYGIKYPLKYPFEAYTHLLMAGCSGGGKTLSILYILYQFVLECYESHIQPVIYVCDFKNSEDFRFLSGYPLYYAGNECYEGIEDFYQQFTNMRQHGFSRPKQRYLLLIDEYGSLLSYFQAQDKITKDKKANTIISIVSEILMLGRSNSTGCWICTQYATADLFKGSRINFMLVITLGRQNREQLTMLYSGEEIPPNRIYQPGEGLILADGFPLTEIKFPLVNLTELKQLIRKLLFKAIC